MIDESRKGAAADIDNEHPYAWYGRRLRDVHDLWHILTGYNRDAMGEACLASFSSVQMRSLGFGFIAVGAAFKLRSILPKQPVFRSVWEAYNLGKRARWLPGEDYLQLLAEPLEKARLRLNISRPLTYEAVPQAVRDSLGADLKAVA